MTLTRKRWRAISRADLARRPLRTRMSILNQQSNLSCQRRAEAGAGERLNARRGACASGATRRR